LPHDFRVAGEMTLPQAVAENCHFVFAGLVFPRRERAAEQGRHAEQGEEIRLRGEGDDMVRLAPAAQVPVSLPAKQRHVLEGAVLGLPVDEIGTGKGMMLKIAVLAPIPIASVAVATIAKPGDFPRLRTAWRRS